MDPDYAQAYERLYRQHWWWRAREEYIVAVLRKLELPSAARILDIGCGGGWSFDRLAEFGEVHGVEPDSTLVPSHCPHASRIHIGPFDKNYRPEKPFDLIVMLDVLEHLEDRASALALVADLLSPTGKVLITVPASMALWTNHDVLNHHCTRFSKRELRAVARQAGFRTGLIQYFFHWLVPLKMMVRILEGISPGNPAPPRVPPAPINGLLYRWSRLEQFLFSRMPLPLGASLLYVGEKRPAAVGEVRQ